MESSSVKDSLIPSLLTCWHFGVGLDSGLMWSVTEQNHLHYPRVMFHCFRLVLWWPPTHFSASFSLLLWLRVSVFCKCVVTNVRLQSSIFWTHFSADFYFISPSPISFLCLHLLSVVSRLSCIISLWCTHISSSHFALPWDVAMCLHSLVWLLWCCCSL